MTKKAKDSVGNAAKADKKKRPTSKLKLDFFEGRPSSQVALKNPKSSQAVARPSLELRTIVEIIADSRSGVPIPSSEMEKFKKRKQISKLNKPLPTHYSKAADQSSPKPRQPVLCMINGQAVI